MAPLLAAVSDDLNSNFAGAVKEALDAGLDGLAVRNVDGVNVSALTAEDIRLVRNIAENYGMKISAISSPVGRDVALTDDDASSLELLDRMISYADILGTPLVRVFAPWIPGKDPIREWWTRPAGVDRIDRVAERLERYVRRAEISGVTLMLELEGASHVGKAAEALEVIDLIGSPSLALCWDVCNGWWSGEDPWMEGWPAASRVPIVDVQTKDVQADHAAPSRPTYRQVRLSQGDVPYQRIVEALRKNGYDGWFTVERVFHPRRPEDDRELLDDIRADISALHRLVGSTPAARRNSNMNREKNAYRDA